MNKISIKINIVILILFGFGLNSSTAQNSNYKQVNSQEFNKLIHSGKGMILDVRTKGEFESEHIENSGQLNFYAFDFKKKLDLLPKDQEIYLYCNTGYRSEKTAKMLLKKGYTNVYNLERGIMEWNIENLPVIVGEKTDKKQADKISVDQYANIIASDSLILIDFYAPWCGPCRKMMPLIDSIKTLYHPRLKVVKVNADASKKLIKQQKIIGVPLFRLYKKNELLYYKDGIITRNELMAVIDKELSAVRKK